jgi:hypothetical protein
MEWFARADDRDLLCLGPEVPQRRSRHVSHFDTVFPRRMDFHKACVHPVQTVESVTLDIGVDDREQVDVAPVFVEVPGNERAVHIQADQRIVRVPLNLVGQATQQRFDLGILCDRHGPSVVDSPPLLHLLPEVVARREDRLFAVPPPLLASHVLTRERQRPHACMSGWVFVGYIDEYGEEREASYACRHCTASPR